LGLQRRLLPDEAVSSYLTFSTLPPLRSSGAISCQLSAISKMLKADGCEWQLCCHVLNAPLLRTGSAVYFLLHFPLPCDSQLLAGTRLFGARTFLTPYRGLSAWSFRLSAISERKEL